MTAEHGNDMLSRRVDADDGGVGVLVVHARGDGAHSDAKGTGEDKGVELAPLGRHFLTGEERSTGFLSHDVGHAPTTFVHLYDGCFHCFLAFNMSMG